LDGGEFAKFVVRPRKKYRLESLGKWSLGKPRSRKEDSTLIGIEEYRPEECRWKALYKIGSCRRGR
jgi:hypothetical protein